MKALIILKHIGDFNEDEQFAVNLAIALREKAVEVKIFCEDCSGNESSNRLQTKGVPIFDIAHRSEKEMPREYEALLAIDEWAVEHLPEVTVAKKYRIGNTSDIAEMEQFIITVGEEKIKASKPKPVSKPRAKAKAKSKSQKRRIAAQKKPVAKEKEAIAKI